jgi:hypothetical protein
MLIKEMITVHSENHMKQNEELLIVKAGGIHSYHWALNG